MTCLDGPLQGKTFSLFEGLKLSNRPGDEITIHKISAGYYEVESNSDGMLVLTAKESAPSLSGGDEDRSLTLIPGIIFTVAETTFAVQEAEAKDMAAPESREEASKSFNEFADLLIEAAKSTRSTADVKLLETPLKFDFVRGFWMNQSWLLQHSPIAMSTVSPLYFFPDEKIETQDVFLTLELKGSSNAPHLSTPFDNLIKINGEAITSQEVFDGDFVEFGKTAFYISFHEKD